MFDTIPKILLLVVPVGIGCFFLWWLYRLFLQRYFHNLFGVVINVTQEDIDLGCKGGQGTCPIARAITRELKKKYPDNVEVHGSIASIINGETCDISIFYGFDNNFWLASKEHGGEWKGRGTPQYWIDYWGHPQMLQISRFACQFDIGREVTPFSFKLLL